MVFKFRLQTLLDHKVRQEEAIQIELGLLREDHRMECLVLKALEEDEATQRTRLRRQQTNATLNLPAIGWSLNYLDVLKTKKALQWDLIAGLTAKIEHRRQALLAVMRERKTLEKLKERQYEHYSLEQKRREVRVTDEISMSQYARRSK